MITKNKAKKTNEKDIETTTCKKKKYKMFLNVVEFVFVCLFGITILEKKIKTKNN